VYQDNILIGYKVYYAKITNQEIYELFKAEDSIKLDECFIHNFSLLEYAKYCGLDCRLISKDELKLPQNFSAKLSFWEGKTDFSYSIWENIDFTFYGSFFGGISVDFSSIQISKGFFDFNKIYISNGINFSISFTKIIIGDIFLEPSYFESGRQEFISLYLEQGSIYFTNTYFKDMILYLIDVDIKGINLSLAEYRNSKIYIIESQIREGIKLFSEIYLENSILSFKNTLFGSGDINFTYLEAIKSKVDFRNTRIPLRYNRFFLYDM